MKTFRFVIMGALLAVSLWAADPTGKWTAEMQGRDGNKREVTMNLKADGDKLTGTVGGPMGDTDITDGKVDGDNISFTVVREFNGNQMKMNYKGAVSGDQIKFKVARDGAQEGRTMEFTAKRSQ